MIALSFPRLLNARCPIVSRWLVNSIVSILEQQLKQFAGILVICSGILKWVRPFALWKAPGSKMIFSKLTGFTGDKVFSKADPPMCLTVEGIFVWSLRHSKKAPDCISCKSSGRTKNSSWLLNINASFPMTLHDLGMTTSFNLLDVKFA